MQVGIAAHTGEESVVSRVPASLEAFCAFERVSGGAMWAQMTELPEEADESVVRSHWLNSCAGRGLTVSHTLVAKRIARGGQVRPSVGAQPYSRPMDVLYDGTWQTDSLISRTPEASGNNWLRINTGTGSHRSHSKFPSLRRSYNGEKLQKSRRLQM